MFYREAGQFKASYQTDAAIFPIRQDRIAIACIVAIAFVAIPLFATPYVFTAWWPWVKGYQGELRAGAVRPGPIYSRLWIDQDLKKKMGF